MCDVVAVRPVIDAGALFWLNADTTRKARPNSSTASTMIHASLVCPLTGTMGVSVVATSADDSPWLSHPLPTIPEMLLARTCAVCGRAGAAVCGACLADLRPAPALPPPPGVHDCRALLSYEGPARQLVARLKYRNQRGALGGLAAAAASLVAPDEVDVVTWAPTTAARRRRRGYDQSELLAWGVARGLGRPCVRLLRRSPGPAQTGRSAAERWASPGFTLCRRVAGRILLVDDVVTTGATVSAAARCLQDEGLSPPVVLVLARTPLKATTESDEEET